jgi:hypothetical protein
MSCSAKWRGEIIKRRGVQGRGKRVDKALVRGDGKEGARGALFRAGRRFSGGKERDGVGGARLVVTAANGTDLVVVSTVLVGGLSHPVGNCRRWVVFPWAFFAFETVDMRRKMVHLVLEQKEGNTCQVGTEA